VESGQPVRSNGLVKNGPGDNASRPSKEARAGRPIGGLTDALAVVDRNGANALPLPQYPCLPDP